MKFKDMYPFTTENHLKITYKCKDLVYKTGSQADDTPFPLLTKGNSENS